MAFHYTCFLQPYITLTLFSSKYSLQQYRDSSVGTAIRYGLGGPGIESRWRPDFPQPSRPALRSA